MLVVVGKTVQAVLRATKKKVSDYFKPSFPLPLVSPFLLFIVTCKGGNKDKKAFEVVSSPEDRPNYNLLQGIQMNSFYMPSA